MVKQTMASSQVTERLEAEIPADLASVRLDKALATLFGEHSRASIQQWIDEGRVSLDGRSPGRRDKVRAGQRVTIEVPPPQAADWVAQPIPLEIVYEDAALIVVNKPAGLVVHPGSGNPDHTLLNALLHHDPGLATLPRAGIVHRIDKETSGLLVIGRSEAAVRYLVAAIQAREVRREYLAVISAVPVAGGRVDAPIGRHPRDRTRMAVNRSGRPAVSHFRVLERYRGYSLVRVRLETGRTHQIRVHMQHLGHPLVGDPVYGHRLAIPAGAGPELVEALRGFRRQALHAETLALRHPLDGTEMTWSVPLPDDMQQLVTALRRDRDAHD